MQDADDASLLCMQRWLRQDAMSYSVLHIPTAVFLNTSSDKVT
jgi:hypothetical protein